MWDCAVFLLLVPHLQIVSHSLTTSAGHALFHCLVFTPWIQREGFLLYSQDIFSFCGGFAEKCFSVLRGWFNTKLSEAIYGYFWIRK